MGNMNASSPGGKQSCENYSEALLYNPNAYIASSSTNPPIGGNLAGELEPVHSLALLHSIENALVSGGDKVVTVCDWTSGTPLSALSVHTKGISQVLGTHGPTSVYASSRDHNVYQWSMGSCGPPVGPQLPSAVYRGHEFAVTTIASSTAHKQYLCSGSRDTCLRLWDTGTQQCVRQQAIARNLITHIVWPSGDNSVVQCSEDKTLRLWDTRTLEPVLQFPQCKNILMCCDCLDGGRYIVTGQSGSQAAAVVWDVRTKRAVCSLYGHLSSITSCRFLPSLTHCPPSQGNLPIATCSQDGSIKLWNINLANSDCSVEPVASHAVPGSGGLTSLEVLEENKIACSSFRAGVSVWEIGGNGKFTLRAQY